MPKETQKMVWPTIALLKKNSFGSSITLFSRSSQCLEIC
ncbi:hypothetical protein BH10BDE1_BH10BDE1_23100 [soil metagenome]